MLKSDLIINSPTAYLDELPDDMKAAIRQAYFDAPTKAPAAFAKLSDGKNRPWAPITNADYDDTIKLIKFVDELKKKKLTAEKPVCRSRRRRAGSAAFRRRHPAG